jgi:chaperonin cofactor prefoldin
MAVPARKFDVEDSMETDERLGRLEERTQTLQRDVGQITSNLTRIEEKLDARFDGLSIAVSSLTAKVSEFEPKFEAIAASIDAKLSGRENRFLKWMIATVLTSASAAFAFAKLVN